MKVCVRFVYSPPPPPPRLSGVVDCRVCSIEQHPPRSTTIRHAVRHRGHRKEEGDVFYIKTKPNVFYFPKNSELFDNPEWPPSVGTVAAAASSNHPQQTRLKMVKHLGFGVGI